MKRLGSSEVLFSHNLCRGCNNRRSQPFDIAYDIFASYIKAHEEEIWVTKQFRLASIYGADWKKRRDDLVKYYLKHICCRLASDRVFIRPDVIDHLNGNGPLKFVSMYLEIREDIVAMIRDSGDAGLWLGDMMCMISKNTGEINEVTSFHGYRWLRLYWRYDERLLAPQNSFSTDEVELESGYNVPPESIATN